MGNTKLKICGLYRPEDISYVNKALPEYAGFITYEKSHRFVSKEQLRELKKDLDPRIQAVGVFVNKPVDEVASYVQEQLVDLVQLHGDESDAYIAELRTKLPEGTAIIKAFLIGTAEDLEQAKASSADYILLDNVAFGSGKPFDWSLLKEDLHRPYFFAGGLNPDNVATVAEQFRPFAVDISSGVETDKKKDLEKIMAVRAKIK